MKILLLGGFGYIGSVLSEFLLSQTKEKITVLDILEFGVNPAYFYNILKNDRIEYVKGDIANMHIAYNLIQKHDLVIDLIALTLPNSAKDPGSAMFVNQTMAEIVGDCCQKLNKRMIFMSTCSNYGKSETPVNEKAELFPVSIYAISKVNAEKYLLKNTPNATILRCATAYGTSPGRTRWDVLLNDLVRTAVDNSAIEIFQPNAHRPICHVSDISKAIYMISQNPDLDSRIFNVGSNSQNYTKQELAEMVAKHTGVDITYVENDDNRDYAVDFGLIKKSLGFKALRTPDDTIPELIKELAKREVQ